MRETVTLSPSLPIILTQTLGGGRAAGTEGRTLPYTCSIRFYSLPTYHQKGTVRKRCAILYVENASIEPVKSLC